MCYIFYKFKEVREQKGMSVNAVADIIRIKPKFITLIEDGNVFDVIDDVYMIGFIRSYAKFLKIDADLFVDFYKQRYINNVLIEEKTSCIENIKLWCKMRCLSFQKYCCGKSDANCDDE